MIDRSRELYVSVCDVTYNHDPLAYKNCPRGTLQIAIPRYTKDNPPAPGFATTGTPFLTCRIEDAEYSRESLVDSLNSELRNKLPSSFKGREFQFVYNSNIDRIEISVDGSPNVFTPDRVTAIIFHPLSKTIGLTKSDEASASYCFGAPNPPSVPKGKISQESHATAQFAPHLPRPHFIKLYLDAIEQELDGDAINPLLAVISRPPLPISSSS